MKNNFLYVVCLLLIATIAQAEPTVSLEKILYKNCYTSYKDQYVNFKNHKVFTYAMDATGVNSCGWAYGHDDLEQAKKDAITSCERNKVNSPCKFIDIDGETVVKEGEFPILLPADEHKLTEEELDRMMKDAKPVINGNCLPFYKKYLTTMYGHRAFAYVRETNGDYACGMSGSGHSILEPAKQAALEQCEINKEKRGDKKPESICKIYAANYDVIAKKEDFSVDPDTTSFMAAVLTGNVDLVKEYLASGTDINFESKKGITPIFVAAMTGNFELYEFLLKKGADLDVVHNDGSNLLMAAIGGKNINILRSLLEKNLDVNKQDNDGNTSLHLAVMTMEIPIIKALIDHGADTSKENNKGMSPQALALPIKLDLNNLESKTSETVDVNARDEDGWTPLFWAAKENDLQKINELLDRGADIDARDDFGSTSLTYAINHEHFLAVRLLLKKGADVHNEDEGGETPLMDAANKQNLKIVNFLLLNDADKFAKDNEGKTALDHLGSNADEELKKVLSLDEEQSSKDKEPEPKRIYVRTEPGTPLQLAVAQGEVEAITKLLSEDIDQKNSDGITAVFIAAIIGDYKTFNLLLDKGTDLQVTHMDGTNLLMAAVLGGNINIFRLLLNKNFDLDQQRNDGNTALHMASSESKLSSVIGDLLFRDADSLIKNNEGFSATELAEKTGYDLVAYRKNIKASNGEEIQFENGYLDGEPRLFWAARYNELAKIKKWIEEGDDIHARDEKRGRTAFYLAVRLEHPEVAEFLIEKGAKINDRDNDDRTPLMSSLFINDNNTKIVKLLLSHGADKSLQDKKGKTAFDYLSRGASLELKGLVQ